MDIDTHNINIDINIDINKDMAIAISIDIDIIDNIDIGAQVILQEDNARLQYKKNVRSVNGKLSFSQAPQGPFMLLISHHQVG